MAEKDSGEVQVDQVEWKVQPDSNHEVQPVWYDHMREACHSEETMLKSTGLPACRVTCPARARPFFGNNVKFLPEKSWLR